DPLGLSLSIHELVLRRAQDDRALRLSLILSWSKDERRGQTVHDDFRFSRNARSPSWPSVDTRRSAIAAAVTAVTSAGARPTTFLISAFAAATASGDAESSSCT